MKKLRLLRVIASMLVIASIIAINPIGASAEWKQDSNGWWNTEGSLWSVGWRLIDGKWYYFEQDGYMKTGWLQDSNGKWYYLNSDGSMAHDTIIAGYTLGSDGAWIQATATNNSETQNQSNKESFTMKTEKSVYELGTKEIYVYITNNSDSTIGFSRVFAVEKFENNIWSELKISDGIGFEEIGILINSKETSSKQKCDLSTLKDFEKLTPGRYRIIKEIHNIRITAEFELG